ncbi:hypothetical protein JD844_012210 [Phrynosoma platyrhinos]|uniref:N-terminal Ras-GEF domain-containing protein n=1 Tax=Phrynosoma platyrhinos TaxID=52577 RepID=A0ABQ7TJY8_PHRPL|nr:hypothetical protein JD844_012210 [Phrynosoma platyrhinos]
MLQTKLHIFSVVPFILNDEVGMPQTLSSASMFTPCGFSPHHLHPSKDDDEGGLIFQDGNLTSASLDALIQHLTPTADYYPEKAYIFTFLLSSRLFIEPHELLSRVCHKCIEQQQLDDPVLDKVSRFDGRNR